MTGLSGIDWEDAFQNGAYIPNAASYPEFWATRAKSFRTGARAALDLAYGAHLRERLDLFLPPRHPRGLAVIVHGGYWLRFDKSSWSDLAEGALALGWAVAMPSYPLAPEATIPEITIVIARAVEMAAGRVDGPIRLAGHSAGGHLVTRMICEAGPLSEAVAERIERVVSISGLHDLRPLQLHSMNGDLGLDEAIAAAESTVLCQPRPGAAIVAWVGGLERPEFLRQSALLTEAWGRRGVSARLVVEPDRHHFDVIDGLKAADHPLTQAFAGD